jgi:thioredoxin 1
MIVEYTNNEEINDLIQRDELILVKFGAEWCGPCKMFDPVLNEVSKQQDIVQVDVDKDQELAKKYGIRSVPTVLFLKKGEEVFKTIGLKSKTDMLNIISKFV